MILDAFFITLSVIAVVMGLIRMVNYDLAFRIEIALKQAVRMRLPQRTPAWESSSRFTGMMLIVLGGFNLIALLTRGGA